MTATNSRSRGRSRRALLAVLFVGPYAFGAPTAAPAIPSSPSPSELWNVVVDGSAEDPEGVIDLSVSPGGGKVFALTSSGGGSVLLALDASTGTELWATATSPGPSVAITDSAGQVFVTGPSGTQALDATDGASRWTSPQGGRAIALAGPGRVVVAGSSVTSLSPSSGDTIWEAPFTGTAQALAVDPGSSSITATGSVLTSDRERQCDDGDCWWIHLRDFSTARYSPAGALRWGRTLDVGHEDDLAQSIAISANGRVAYVGGYTHGYVCFFCWSPQFHEDTVVAYSSSSGVERWRHTYNTERTQPYLFSNPVSVAASPDGSTVFFAATDDFDWIVMGLDAADGRMIWHRRPLGGVTPIDAASTFDGDVVVTGDGRSGDRPVQLTIRFDGTTGSLIWRTGFGSPDLVSRFGALATSPDAVIIGTSSGLDPAWVCSPCDSQLAAENLTSPLG